MLQAMRGSAPSAQSLKRKKWCGLTAVLVPCVTHIVFDFSATIAYHHPLPPFQRRRELSFRLPLLHPSAPSASNMLKSWRSFVRPTSAFSQPLATPRA